MDQPVAANYFMQIAVVDENGVPITREDALISATLSSSWIPGIHYLDGRTLQIPCDTPPGDYNVIMTVYSIEGDTTIELTGHFKGSPTGTVMYLTTLNVNEDSS